MAEKKKKKGREFLKEGKGGCSVAARQEHIKGDLFTGSGPLGRQKDRHRKTQNLSEKNAPLTE